MIACQNPSQTLDALPPAIAAATARAAAETASQANTETRQALAVVRRVARTHDLPEGLLTVLAGTRSRYADAYADDATRAFTRLQQPRIAFIPPHPLHLP